MNNELKEATKLMQNRKYTEAAELLQKISAEQLSLTDKIEYEYLMGIYLFETTTIDAAMVKFKTCIEIVKNNNLEYNLTNIYYEISIAYFRLYMQNGDRTNLKYSSNYCKQALDIALNNSIVVKTGGLMVYAEESPESYINMFIHLGVLYQTMKKLDESITILLVAKTICQHFSRLDLLGQVYDELGTSYMFLGESELAGYYFVKAVKAKEIINNRKGIEISIQKHILCTLSNPHSFESKEQIRLQNLVLKERI